MELGGGKPFSSGMSRRDVKRKWREISQVASLPRGILPPRRPLCFSEEDYLLGEPNEYIPLIISASISGVEIERVLVDQGSAADIMFQDLLPAFGLSPEGLIPYLGPVLTVLGEKIPKPLGYFNTFDTYREKKLARAIKTTFVVVPMVSPYRCIIGRPTLARLGDVASVVHLKLKFLSLDGEVITIPVGPNH